MNKIACCNKVNSLLKNKATLKSLMSFKTVKKVRQLRHITITEENYVRLKQLEKAGDSFNDGSNEEKKKIVKIPQLQRDLELGDQGSDAAGANVAVVVDSSTPPVGQDGEPLT